MGFVQVCYGIPIGVNTLEVETAVILVNHRVTSSGGFVLVMFTINKTSK